MAKSRGRPVYYNDKICKACGTSFTPTSGRQEVCTESSCKRWIVARRHARKRAVYAERHPRPSEKLCEWPDCGVLFPVSWTGIVPTYCPEHYQRSIGQRQQASTAEWRLRTLDVQCRHPVCDRKQHPSAKGWCYYHYPILSVHGLGADEWWAFYNQQNGLCPICGLILLDGRTIAIDHDRVAAPKARHTKEYARGLLHAAPCNSVIVGGVETAIANGWFNNTLAYIQFPLPESNQHK